METLAKNSEKAGLVRLLVIEYAHCNTDKNRRVTTYLSKILKNMHSLSDFRVRYSQGHSRLRALYCPELLSISRIVKSQTELQILGLYHRDYYGSARNILIALKELHDAQLLLPIVFTFRLGYYCNYLTYIPIYVRRFGIFPAFYSVDRFATVSQILAESFRKDQGKDSDVDARADMIFEISIYLIDTSDMPSFYALAKELAVSFHQIVWLNLYFDSRRPLSPLFLLL